MCRKAVCWRQSKLHGQGSGTPNHSEKMASALLPCTWRVSCVPQVQGTSISLRSTTAPFMWKQLQSPADFTGGRISWCGGCSTAQRQGGVEAAHLQFSQGTCFHPSIANSVFVLYSQHCNQSAIKKKNV